MTELVTQKDYVWFIDDITIVAPRKVPKLQLTFQEKTTGYRIKEQYFITNLTNGARVLDTMKRLGWVQKSKDTQPDPKSFFERGMHMVAQVNRQYSTESANESISFHINDETIRMYGSLGGHVDENIKKRILGLTQGVTRKNEMIERLAPKGYDLVVAAIKLVESGEVVLA